MPRTELILALDTPDLASALAAARAAKGVKFFKIGPALFTREGPGAVEAIQGLGGRVFLDLKLHDIPNTVKAAVEGAAKLGVHAVSLHVAGGKAMMEAALSARNRPKLWGITVLTSFEPAGFLRTGSRYDIETAVLKFGDLAAEAGLDGLVSSPRETARLRRRFPKMKLITPGVRPAGGEAGDQARAATPAEARAAGADFMVVGRPIIAAKDPAAAARAIMEELSC